MLKKFINANIYGNDSDEILVKDGFILEVGKNLQDADEVIDLEGNLVLPPYVDPHLHLDYVYTGKNSGAKNATGTLFEGIARWHEIKEHETTEDFKNRARRAIKEELSYGVQHIRTHVDICDKDLKGLKALLELRDELKDYVDIQIVSFPQEGMFAYKGGLELVEEGLRMGADCVGAIPHFEWAEEIGNKSIHETVRLALKYDKMIDVHCDETDDPNSRFLQLLNALVMIEGIGKKTAASHTCSLGSADNAYAFRLLSLLKDSKINMIAPVTENAYLQGRADSYPKRRGITRVKEFMEMGINVCFAQDSINDPWYPVGNGNMMNILDNGIHLAQIMSFEELERDFDLITFNGAKTMMLQNYGIEKGNPCNFIVLDEKSTFEAIRRRVNVIASVRNGEYLFKLAPKKYEFELNI